MKVIATTSDNKVQLVMAENGVLGTMGSIADANGKTSGKFCLFVAGCEDLYFDAESEARAAFNKAAGVEVDTKAVIAFHSPAVLEAISMVGSTSFTLAGIADDFSATLKREGAQVSDEWLAKVRTAILNHFMIDEVEAALKF